MPEYKGNVFLAIDPLAEQSPEIFSPWDICMLGIFKCSKFELNKVRMLIEKILVIYLMHVNITFEEFALI